MTYNDSRVLKTYLWIKETANSKRTNNKSPISVPSITTPGREDIGPLTNTISKCPATILAASRTESVKGRITVLMSSINTIKGING